ncbi:hypothetical protein F441_18255 [Phytophthora nicotianae CJ01A1]|uniref:Uncharacterized protein n=4 Tax=Phytophthora nicotianae TaxID=4792 RepID=W2YGE1_PHYNI|nr:hypothetical protein L915_17887 [Phytophthora nicotianae]ETO64001.1 hypothetical protein F444_18399 [Phytophthora nicotianae P1976]ETP05083.1 hypothetical protein F441_18255 [Phytophthora nicotianae CJ01A1]ETP33229.1 hypothetical protein F442_18207 [Phytophthora nicotianae P10297]KUF92758.1 Coagulation factor XI [Phytophthora nicotianae]
MRDDDLKRAFQTLCVDYEELLDEAAQATQPADERVGLALFKIDEACAAADGLRQDAEQIQEQLLSELLSNCHELEDIFLRVNLIERFVGRMLQTTRELEKRMESVSRAAGPVFNSSTSVTSLLRSFSMKRGASEAPLTDGKWSPVAFDFNTKELMERLEKSDARELGVSISSSSATETAAETGEQPPPADTGSDAEAESDSD